MSPSTLECRGLSKTYDSAGQPFDALKGVNLRLKAGESLAVVGPSGSGKSTLLGLLAGLEAPSAGSVRVEGRDLGSMNEDELAAFRGRRIGFVFQSYRLLPALSALENVRLPLDLAGAGDAREKALEWLEKVGLSGRQSHRPAELSGGEQQRVAIARALAPGPALLLADEPTGNLDSASGKKIEALLFGLAKSSSTALVLVTHDPAMARRAGHRLHFKDGRVEKGGTRLARRR